MKLSPTERSAIIRSRKNWPLRAGVLDYPHVTVLRYNVKVLTAITKNGIVPYFSHDYRIAIISDAENAWDKKPKCAAASIIG